MSENTAMAISLGVFGSMATYLFIAYGGSLSLWAAFVAWACFFHAGGGSNAAILTTCSTLFGCFLGWATMLGITSGGLSSLFGVPLWGAICVAISAPIAVLAGRIATLAAVPITMSALACIAAFVSLKGNDMMDAAGSSNMLALSINSNALFNISISMLIGLLFGLATERFAALLIGKSSSKERENA